MRQQLPILAFFLTAVAMYALLMNGVELSPSLHVPAAVISISSIALLSVLGLFEKSIIKYAYYSALIQLGYFMLDVSTALLIGKSVWFAVLQFINFIIAGCLFALIIAIFNNAVRKEEIPQYAGLYQRNQMLVLALAVSSLSLGGMPGFNIFVGEYLIYSALFSVHPALTIGAVFAGLLCFLFYFRICYVMFAGNKKTMVRMGPLSRLIVGLLALIIIMLGVVPHILMSVLGMFI